MLVDYEKYMPWRQGPTGLSVRQQQPQLLHVGCVDDVAFAQGAFSLTGLFRQDVTGKRLGIGILSASGPFEPFRCGPIGLNFGHCILLTKKIDGVSDHYRYATI